MRVGRAAVRVGGAVEAAVALAVALGGEDREPVAVAGEEAVALLLPPPPKLAVGAGEKEAGRVARGVPLPEKLRRVATAVMLGVAVGVRRALALVEEVALALALALEVLQAVAVGRAEGESVGLLV